MPLPVLHYLYSSGLPKYLHVDAEGKSSWALVTGASDGIGFELCNELSRSGFNVVLHARNQEKLDRCVSKLESTHPNCSYRTIVADASTFTQLDIDRMATSVKDIPLSILINNVGGTATLHTNFMRFEDITPAEMLSVFQMNVQFPLQLTKALLPQLTRLQRPALILTCGSLSHVGQAYLAAYSGCKGALHAWNRALAAEQHRAQSQIDVLEVLVGGTYTQQLQADASFSPGLFMPHADRMARSILARVGNGHRSVIPYFWHSVQFHSLSALLPGSVVDSIMASILGKDVPPPSAAGK